MFASLWVANPHKGRLPLSDLRLVSLDDEPRSSVSLSSTRATTVPLPHTIYAYWSINCHLMHLFHCGIQNENAVRKNLKPVSQQGLIPWREARRCAGEDKSHIRSCGVSEACRRGTMNERGILGDSGSRGARRDASIARKPPSVRVKRDQGVRRSYATRIRR